MDLDRSALCSFWGLNGLYVPDVVVRVNIVGEKQFNGDLIDYVMFLFEKHNALTENFVVTTTVISSLFLSNNFDSI